MAITINGTTGLSGVDGSAGTPALQGSDSNTGISFGTDEVNINTGGITRATVDSSGRVGISVTAPEQLLHIGGNNGIRFGDAASANNADITYTNVGDEFLDIKIRGTAANYGNIRFYTGPTPTERMRINSSGQVGIGRSPAYALDVKAEDQTARLVVTNHSGNNSAIGFSNSNGEYENGHIHSYSLKIATGSGALFSGTTGVQLANAATSWSTLSDERRKTNLAPIENGLSKVASLRACTGRYLTDEPEKSRSFLIAQDVRTVLPEAVFNEDDADKTLNLCYTEVIPLLVAALKESKERIETLETRLTALEGGVAQ